MKPLRTRDDLLEIAARNAPTTACGRTIREKGATILGGFTFAGGLLGWIVKVRSEFHTWFIAIICDEPRRKYSIEYLRIEQIPWKDWIGDSQGKRPLTDGDMPIRAAWERFKCRQRG